MFSNVYVEQLGFKNNYKFRFPLFNCSEYEEISMCKRLVLESVLKFKTERESLTCRLVVLFLLAWLLICILKMPFTALLTLRFR